MEKLVSPIAIKDIDGLPQGEIRELIKDGDRAVMDSLGGRMTSMENRVGAVENRLVKIEEQLVIAKELAQKGVSLGEQSVAQNSELLAKFDSLKVQIEETRTETKDGVVISKKLTKWGETAHDFKLYELGKWGLRLACFWGAAKLVGYVAGPQLRDQIFEVIKKLL